VYHGLSPQVRPVEDTHAIAAAQARYGITSGEPAHPPRYFLYIGTVQPRKNLVRLIDGFAQAVKGCAGSSPLPRDLLLVIAGKRGWLTETIEQRAASAGIAERVRFTGYVDDADLPALLSGSHAFVFPSLYEGFGMPVLEAMACGAPVLTSTTSSLPEVAGDAALLVDPHDTQAIASALARLADDATLCDELRRRGRERAAHFTWERCAEETFRVLL
jgi:glycosyltransferase involved in cell wall biosynthesis